MRQHPCLAAMNVDARSPIPADRQRSRRLWRFRLWDSQRLIDPFQHSLDCADLGSSLGRYRLVIESGSNETKHIGLVSTHHRRCPLGVEHIAIPDERRLDGVAELLRRCEVVLGEG